MKIEFIVFGMLLLTMMFIMTVCLWQLTEQVKHVIARINNIRDVIPNEDHLYDELLDIEYRVGDAAQTSKEVLAAITRFCEVNDENMLRVQELIEDSKNDRLHNGG